MRHPDRSSPPPVAHPFAGPVRTIAMSMLMATGSLLAVVALYVVKSKLGINLLHGPSPLHGVFVSMREAGLV